MTTIQRTETHCDLCGYGGHYSRPEDFARRAGFDFCRWCMSEGAVRQECGGHVVDIDREAGTWVCSCGMGIAMLRVKLWRYGVSWEAMAAVPDPLTATAVLHVQTPRWPATY